VADHGDPLGLGAVRRCKLDIVPERLGIPAAKVTKPRQQADLALLADGLIDQRHELFVVLVVKLARHFEAENIGRVDRQLLNYRRSPFVMERPHDYEGPMAWPTLLPMSSAMRTAM